MISIALIGLGRMGKNHLRVLGGLQDCRLVAICDPDAKASQIAKELGLNYYSTVEKLLEHEEFDCVDICVPTTLHESVAIACLECGKHVFVEKPISHSVASAMKIIEAAKVNNRVLMVGHIERFNPTIRVLKEAIKDEKILSLYFTRVGPMPPRIQDVGVVFDLGVHDIDLARFLTNSDISGVFCLSRGEKVEQSAQILLKMANDCSANINLNWFTPFKVREINVVTSNQVFVANLITKEVRSYSSYKATPNISYQVELFEVGNAEPLKSELMHFVECVKNNTTPLTSGAEALSALQAAEAAMRSSKERRFVSLP